MSDDIVPPDDTAPDMAAAELALGLLDGEERSAALRRVLADRGFAAEVETWRGHLAQLFDLWPEMTVSGDVLARIERSLDAPVAPVAAAPVQRRWVWPAMTGLSSLAAAALLLVLVTRPVAPPPLAPKPATTAPVPATMLVAAIAGKAGTPVTAVYDPASGGMRVTSQALADAKRSAELWVIAGDGVPHSLGLLPATGGTMAVNGANRARLAAGATLAVSLEPIGGSPTGLPTGPVVATGALSRV